MLVLSRKKNESIRIGDDIKVKVLDIRGGHVRLGIVAPMDVPVMRQELLFDDDAADCSALPSSRDNDTVIARKEEPLRDDTLRAGTARNHSMRSQPTLPR